ncbi:MAG: hypothetical protein A3F67_02525 [Verrucomicrobia bacterium RIFCSPHIGHO2_12_FULL_41_10]|nr:MAG: hypothetical protein A3F67_02525 [Verrucomicrobia bacterium RIFCSPHIGHO2_12_FULL_41_10]HLB33137.1 Asp-tRNA(Asn)/Glu-tRNA(Gln) amidotransferase subunit GatC [Chthoniobacterales bacterium]
MPTHSHPMDVSYLARLARIELTAEETELFTQQLDRVLEHVEQINRLDLTGIEPMAHAISVFDVVRKDISLESLPKSVILKNAPHDANGLFMVPKVLE